MTRLTPRELAVLRLAAQGLTDRQISERLGTKIGTVSRQMHFGMQRLRARNRAHAVAIMDDAAPGWRTR